MKEIFINLKRFHIPKNYGGICLMDNPKQWIQWVMDETMKLGIGKMDDVNVTYLLPEGLVISAIDQLEKYDLEERKNLNIGCQGVYREDVKKGGNFGAFTANFPASAAKNMGCSWAIIGHSEERKDKLNIIKSFEENCEVDKELSHKAKSAVNKLINGEVLSALERDINVLLCVGETEEERGNGTFQEQKGRIEEVLKAQLEEGMKGIEKYIHKNKVAVGYEPIWAIGPGKVPPGAEYIEFVSSCIKKIIKEKFNYDAVVVYGGGLKKENAGMISKISSIDGGLVALTKFTGDIAFEPKGLKEIIDEYQK